MAASRITLVVIFVATWTECPFSRSAIAQKQKSDSAKSTPLADAEIIEKCGKLESLVQALVNKVRNANEECEKHIQNMQKRSDSSTRHKRSIGQHLLRTSNVFKKWRQWRDWTRSHLKRSSQ